jgi:hypothetical protein
VVVAAPVPGTSRARLFVDDRLAGLVDRVGDSWLMRDVGKLGFGSMSFAGELDERGVAVALDRMRGVVATYAVRGSVF